MGPYWVEKEFKILNLGIWHIIIPLAIGASIMLFSYPEGFYSINTLFFLVIYSLSLGIPCMKAYEYAEWKLESTIPWLKNPFKRLVISVFTEMVIGIILLVVINFLFYFVFQHKNSTEILQKTVQGLKYLIPYTFLGILIINCVFFFRSWRQSAINEEKLKREKLAIEFQALKNQVNPHFLFNNLTALSALVYQDQDKAARFIDELSNVFRYVLENKEDDIIDLSSEIKLLHSIAFLYKIRNEEGLNIFIDLPNLENKYVIPMALQMLIENAIKHNIASVSKPLNIEIRESDGYIVVSNNLQPRINEVKSGKIGLANIQSRYSYLTSKNVIISNTGEFFFVKIPVLKRNS